MNSFIVGASAGLGRALAEQLARSGHDLYLLASDAQDLEALANDLKIRFKVKVSWLATDLATVDPLFLRQQVISEIKSIDCLFIVAGVSSPDLDFERLNFSQADRLIRINFSAGVHIVQAFFHDLAQNPKGNIVGIGSVASARARKNNTIYASSKRGLEFYFSGLRHSLANRPCKVQFYRLGYADTQMTFGQRGIIPKISPQSAARVIESNLGKDLGVRYLPKWWGIIMAIFSFIPWPVYKRMNF